VQVGGGLLGADSVVGSIPRTLLGEATIVRLVFHARSSDGSEDALTTRNGLPDGAPITVAVSRAAPVPTLSPVAEAVLMLLLIGVAFAALRRGRATAASALLSILVGAGAGIAYAAFGVPTAVDDPADASPPDSRAALETNQVKVVKEASRAGGVRLGDMFNVKASR
jgi:hypothetical protein